MLINKSKDKNPGYCRNHGLKLGLGGSSPLYKDLISFTSLSTSQFFLVLRCGIEPHFSTFIRRDTLQQYATEHFKGCRIRILKVNCLLTICIQSLFLTSDRIRTCYPLRTRKTFDELCIL